jgi:hypothetical protein
MVGVKAIVERSNMAFIRLKNSVSLRTSGDFITLILLSTESAEEPTFGMASIFVLLLS